MRQGLVPLGGQLGGGIGLAEQRFGRGEQFGEVRVTCLFTAPTAYRQILKEGKDSQLASVRRAVSAGEHLPEDVWHEVQRRTGLRLIDGIGATEMLHIFISAADDDIRPGATGRPVPGFSDYRTPVDRLYLCGSGAWPGGAVFGAPGRNAAIEALADLGA